MSSFEFNYYKHHSIELPKKPLETVDAPVDAPVDASVAAPVNYFPFSIQHMQSYYPVYDLFFTMNEKNFDTISLNHKYHITKIHENLEDGTVYDREKKELCTKPVFVKFAPLLDPLRFLTGKYNASTDELCQFSKLNVPGFSKLQSVHNASYVDNFFCYLSSQMLNKHGFANAVDYYGSFLGVQAAFKYNVEYDMEYLMQYEYFSNNRGIIYELDEHAEQIAVSRQMGSQSNKKRIEIFGNIGGKEDKELLLDIEVLDIEEMDRENHGYEPNDNKLDNDKLEDDKSSVINSECKCEYECENSLEKNGEKDNDSGDDDDSEVNYTSGEEEQQNSDDDDENDSSDNSSEEDDEEDEEVEEEDDDDEDVPFYAYLKNYPVQMIFMEKCDGTLDELFEKEWIDEENGNAALMQIIMILLVFQKSFHMTHNDLHTNNIVWSHTTEEFLYYRYNGKTYKVPTYGKIFKLIDFGRAIYKFRGKTFCSDSFAFDGDAATQYNFEPYYNANKPLLEPNYSFDLCRLGCSIFDFLFEEPKQNIRKLDSFQQTIYRWVLDDKNHNILYKQTGEERYEGFKMYKMIARTVHAHTPEAQLEFENFKQFEWTNEPKKNEPKKNEPKKNQKNEKNEKNEKNQKKNQKKNENLCVFDIDILPDYTRILPVPL